MRCTGSPVKHRSSRGHGKPGNYRHGMKNHSWKKLVDPVWGHVGRQCTRCPKKILNAKGRGMDRDASDKMQYM